LRGGFFGWQANFLSITIDSQDNIYVAYSDAGISWKAVVKKFDGTSWTAVGNEGLSSSYSDVPYFTLDNNETPYLAYNEGGSTNLFVKKFNGEFWQDIGTFDELGAMRAIVFDANNTPYIAFADSALSYHMTIKKFDGNSWIVVDTEGFTNVQTLNFMMLMNNGELYVIYGDNNNASKATVRKFDGTSWTIIDMGPLAHNQISTKMLDFTMMNCMFFLKMETNPVMFT